MGPIKKQVNIPIPKDVILLKEIFTQNKHELYLVGGAVRDFLMGNPIKDYDLVTDAHPEDIKLMLYKAGIKNIDTGEKFGIVNAIIEGEEYEIATFREESGYSDSRRPDSVAFTDIKTDVSRRDLTINALFYNLVTKEVVDYVGGIDDIENKVVRTVGDASKRFEEDKLRIMRAIRFASRTGSDLDPEIVTYLNSGYDLNDISRERIRDEFLKSIKSAVSVKSLMEMYDNYGMFKWVLGDLSINKGFIEENDPIMVIATLLVGNDKDNVEKTLKNLTYTISEVKDICFIIALVNSLNWETAPMLKKKQMNTNVDGPRILKVGSIFDMDETLLRSFNQYQLTINGVDVMEGFGVSGPEVGKKINELEINKFKEVLKTNQL